MRVSQAVSVSELRSSEDIEVRLVESALDRQTVTRLLEMAYVKEQDRVDSVEQVETAFGTHEEFSTYFVAYKNGIGVGTIKVTVDSALGLPCEGGVGLAALRTGGNRLVEVGHWITVPEVRWNGIGMRLVRHALTYSINFLNATHVLADFFIDGDSSDKLKFYRAVGFKPLCGVYHDARFRDSPASMVAVLETKEVLKRRARMAANKSLCVAVRQDIRST